MERRRLIIGLAPLLFCALALITGCRSDASQSASVSPEATVTATITITEVPPSSEAPQPEVAPTALTSPEAPQPSGKSPRGALTKDIGEDAGLVGDDGASHVQFRVTEIDESYKCTGYDETPQNGRFIGVWLDVTTTPELADAPWPQFDLGDWLVVDAGGLRQNSDPLSVAAAMCANTNDALPYNLDPGLTAKGVVVLDVTATTGFIILNHGGAPAWEWRYGG